MVTFRIRGVVREKESEVPLPGFFIKAFDKDLLFDDLLGSAFSDELGRFEILTELSDFKEIFDSKPDLYFRVYRSDRTTLVYSTEKAVLWNARQLSNVDILIPAAKVAPAAEVRTVFTGDDGAERTTFEIGESLSLHATGLRPRRAYDIKVSAGGRELFSARLLSDSRGRIELTVLWPQLGLDDPLTNARFSPEEADARWRGTELLIVLSEGRQTISKSSLRIESLAERPLAFVSDRDGRLLNAFESKDQPLYLTVRSLPFAGSARAYLVRAQSDWRPGDPFSLATIRDGREAVREAMIELEIPETRGHAVLEIFPQDSLFPGAYDFIIRPLRYGYEEDAALHLLPTDVVSRRITGLIVRENFWLGKPVLGGCVNKIPISGRSISGTPYFRYSDAFAVGEDVWAALDPGIVDPGNLGKMCAFYVIPNKTDAQWNADNSLNHLAVLGGNAAVTKIKVQSGCINGNKVKVWPTAIQTGEYDIVADFGNNVPDAGSFVPNSEYNTPLDCIDGYFEVGFRVVNDPGTFTEPGLFAGTWNYDENIVNAMGLSGTVQVDDENTFYAVPGGFSVVSRTVRLKAHVAFPGDAAGITDPTQISASKPDYPLAVIVHGNGHDYTSYDFLLQHLARNGFIAASIDNRFVSGMSLVHGMHGLGRANNFFKHLEVLRAQFGTKVQNNIGVMGHSRGGEAVPKILRLNQQQALGNNINAAMSLAPTDQYGREVLASPWATPYFVLYGSRDGDVAGWAPFAPFSWRMTGFSLFDRAADAPKSMAFLYKATHNGFITTNSDNGEAGVLAPATQQAVTQAYMSAFFRQHLRNEPEWKGMFEGEWQPPSVSSTGAELHFQYREPGGRTIDDFEGAVNDWTASSIGGTVSQAGLPANPSEGRLFDFASVPGLDTQSPHDSKGLLAQWDSSGDRVTFTIPAAQKDVTSFTTLSIRITQRQGSASNPAGQPQDLRVALKDGGGNERAIRAGAFGPMPFAAVPFPDQRANVDLRKSALSTIRIPLASYTIVCAGQVKVDLANLAELSLQFSMTAAGEIEIDEIEFMH